MKDFTLGCMKTPTQLICYCGKCEPDDYPLPKDFAVIRPEDFKQLEYKVNVEASQEKYCECDRCNLIAE